MLCADEEYCLKKENYLSEFLDNQKTDNLQFWFSLKNNSMGSKESWICFSTVDNSLIIEAENINLPR